MFKTRRSCYIGRKLGPTVTRSCLVSTQGADELYKGQYGRLYFYMNMDLSYLRALFKGSNLVGQFHFFHQKIHSSIFRIVGISDLHRIWADRKLHIVVWTKAVLLCYAVFYIEDKIYVQHITFLCNNTGMFTGYVVCGFLMNKQLNCSSITI